MTVSELGQAWVALATSTDGGIRMVPLGVATAAGAVHAGIDGDGHFHLLVPVNPGTKIATDRRSRAVVVDRRQLLLDGQRRVFVDVECVSVELADVFERFAAEVCDKIADEPTSAAAIPAAVLADWRRLFEGVSSPLSRGQLAGLFGELHVLDSMLVADPAKRIDHWQPESRAIHDFVRAGHAVEVKTTLAREGRNLEVHGVGQLEVPDGGRLHLAFVRLTIDANGRSIGELVAKIRARTHQYHHLDATLSDFGWTNDGDEPPKFLVVEERWYSVDADFPRLVLANMVGARVPEGVSNVRYAIDLGGPSPVPLTESDREAVLREVAGL